MSAPTPDHVWAPVVYGRTLHADFWWRAVPADTERRGWLDDIVYASVNNGRRIDAAPRFALARTDEWVVAGVACAAAEISTDFNRQGQRRLFTFVGWVGPVAAAAQIPPLWRWHADWRAWTAGTYDRWLRDVWTLPSKQLQKPLLSEPGPEAWTPAPEQPVEVPARETSYPADPGTVWVLPAATGAGLWERGRLGASPIRLVTGWDKAGHALLKGITHVTAADVEAARRQPITAPRTVVPRASERSAPTALPAPVKSGPPDPESGFLVRWIGPIPVVGKLVTGHKPPRTDKRGGLGDTTANYGVGAEPLDRPAVPMAASGFESFAANPDFAEPEPEVAPEPEAAPEVEPKPELESEPKEDRPT